MRTIKKKVGKIIMKNKMLGGDIAEDQDAPQ